jgi:ribosome maturation factor RimP
MARSPAGSGRLSDAVTDLLTPVAAAVGYDLEDVDITPAGRRRVLRVVVDRDGGLSLDDVATVSRAIADTLDASDVMGAAPYVLEVSSPGVDRPLTQPRHWRRAAGRLVRVRLKGGGELRGRIVGADDAAVTVDTGSGPETRPYAELGRGRIEVEFDHPEPGVPR